MKILHTADWHIGIKLHKFELKEDFNLFMDWLIELIREREIEVLLVSGDIFDSPNPSSEAREQYYKALLRLKNLNCKIIITGGNHDSPAMLNAPREILKSLDIHVIGGIDAEMKNNIIPVEVNGQTELVVAAIPFLRDSDLRRANEGETYEDRLAVIQKGIENTYRLASEYCTENHCDIPVIGLGHLYTAGAESSDSEREIQLGNQAMFSASRFGEGFAYIALGHIHKPQQVRHVSPAFYSGSPYPLSFSERDDRKRILLIDTEKGFQPESIDIPAFRKLIRISGTLKEIENQLNALNEKLQLTSLLEIHLLEENYNVERMQKLEELISNFNKDGYEIVHRTIKWKNMTTGTGELFGQDQLLAELNPVDVFDKMIEKQALDEETIQGVKLAFFEILEKVQHQTDEK